MLRSRSPPPWGRMGGLFPLGEDLGEASPPLKGEGNGAENKMAYKSPLPLLSEGRGAKGIFVYVLLLSS